MGIKYLLGAAGSKKWLVVRAMDSGARSAPSQKRPLPTDSELVELLWQNGGVVEHSQAQPHHHHHQQAFRRGPSSGNTGRSGVTGEAAAPPPPSLAWLPYGGRDMYAQLEGRVDGDTAVSAWPPATSGAGSTRTGGEVGYSFCGSNAALPGASTSGRSGSSALLLKRAREDELDSRSEDADFDTVDEVTRQSRRSASSKRRTRSAEVHNLSERRRRDRINDKMRALQELVPHCNKTDKASILDETIEYLKSLQMQVQIMWMTTGVVPMMLPGAHQLMSPMGMGLNSPPTTQVLSQMQRTPPFMNNLLPNQMPRVSSAATIIPNVANHVPKNRIAASRNPFLHPNDTLAAGPDELPTLFNYGSQITNKNEMQELLSGAVAPALGPEDPSSSRDGKNLRTPQLSRCSQ